MKVFRINFGWGARGTIAEQLAELGLKVKKDCEDVVEAFESFRAPLIGMHCLGLTTEAETRRIISRATKKLMTVVEDGPNENTN